jgi:aminopeptidase N
MRFGRLAGLVLLAGCAAPPAPADPPPARLKDGVGASGGPLIPEQAAYDVLHYDLRLSVDPAARTIEGVLAVTARARSRLGHLVLDLDDRLAVRGVEGEGRALEFRRKEGRVSVALGSWCEPGRTARVAVAYGGRPREAPNPPWQGGFTWSKTADGRPWIATSCQMEGADLWWPCKDHPSDKPESMDLRVTVPEGLVCASNGRLVEDRSNGDGTRTFHWRIGSPISNYAVALNIAPYETLTESYTSVTGEAVPVAFFVLPEHVEAGRKALPHFLRELRSLEELCGPYPFRAEKYGVAETPHLGMEHQSIIAYGNRFRADRDGYDWLHHHELSHEWWGNLVTCRDWKDMWIHEGIGTYMQALHLERLRGAEGLRREMARYRSGLANREPVAPREDQTSDEIYHLPDGKFNPDIYSKGACVMHALRWLLGDGTFFRVLRRLAYPDPAGERSLPPPVRLSDTDEILAIAERESGRPLGWFFEVYLRQPELPELAVERAAGGLRLRWKAPGGRPFPMPVPVKSGGALRRVEFEEAEARLALADGEAFEIDPERWVLRK